MLTFEDSTTPVARKLKILAYGGAGTGKTWLGIHAPRPLIIDTESSTDAYCGRTDMPPFTVAKSASPSEIIAALDQLSRKGYIQNGDQRLQPETLIIDSFTLLWQVSQEAGQLIAEARAERHKRPVEEARIAFGDWSLIKRPIRRIYTQLLNLPVHVIVTARLKDVYNGNESKPEKIGEAPDIERNAVYNFDLVLKLVVEGRQRVGIVEKSRFAEFPPGMRIPNPSWATFAHLVMEGEQPSQNIDLDDTAAAEARQMEPEPPKRTSKGKGKSTSAKNGNGDHWTANPASVKRAAGYLEENGLTDADANAALDIADWRKTTLDPEAFKAAIEAYIERMVSDSPPALPKNSSACPPTPERTPDPAPQEESIDETSAKK